VRNVRGRPVLGAVAGFFFFGFLGSSLLFLGVLPLDSILLVVLPIVGVPAVAVWGWWAPLGGRRTPGGPPAGTRVAPPPPPAGR
jgi:hypothetical protein